MIIFDLEADNLLDDVTTVHCIVMQDTNSGNVWRFDPTQLDVALDMLKEQESNGGVIGGHNIMAYDLPVLKKLYDFDYYGQVYDTLVASRLIWPNMKEKDLLKRTVDSNLIGSHSLKAWGIRLGCHKGDFAESNDWATYTPDMLEYCIQDTTVNLELFNFLHTQLPTKDQLNVCNA